MVAAAGAAYVAGTAAVVDVVGAREVTAGAALPVEVPKVTEAPPDAQVADAAVTTETAGDA